MPVKSISTPFLPGAELRLANNEGVLTMNWGEQRFELAPPKRALPLTQPDEFLVLSDTNGSEIGVLRSIEELESDSREVMRLALIEAYRVTRITRILNIDRELLSGQISWNVEIENDSSNGSGEDEENLSVSEVTFRIAGAEDVQTARYPQIFFSDVEGNRYEVPNCEALDLASRRMAERYF